MDFRFRVASIRETQEIAMGLAEHLKGGMTIGFKGLLGAGKTEFVRGLAAGLGVKKQISSPSFVLEAEYDFERQGVKMFFNHWDLYRLSWDCELPEFFEKVEDPKSITVVEWPERVCDVERLLSFTVVLAFPGEDAQFREPECAADEEAVEIRDVSFFGVCDRGVGEFLSRRHSGAGL